MHRGVSRGAVVVGLSAALWCLSSGARASTPGPDYAQASSDVRGSAVLLLGGAASAMSGGEASVGFGSGPLRLYVGGMGLTGRAFDLGPGALRPLVVTANVDLCAGVFATDLYSRLCLGGSAGSEIVWWDGFDDPRKTVRPWGGARFGYTYTRWLTPQVGMEAGAEFFVPFVATRYQARVDEVVVDTRGPWRVGMLLRVGLVFRGLGTRR